MREDLAQTSAEKHEHESTIIEQQDHIEKLQDSCRELQEAAQALKQDGDQKYAASLAQIKQDRKQQVQSHSRCCRVQAPDAVSCSNFFWYQPTYTSINESDGEELEPSSPTICYLAFAQSLHLLS